ncbi:hypothetical protein DFH08DRAFT_958607 [Mycena albidolilacea]|uniref:Uncharacterized protein n=1 Tax=Mycena albidolilacea TaxID=1033008 RepID=A0AAD7A5X2_9AGAR|nr:hypothetical protein DFH08DRAFT_958607 [Mycena albidolilacea]
MPKIGIARHRLSITYRNLNGTAFPVAQPGSTKLPQLITEQGGGVRGFSPGYREKIKAEIAKICKDILKVLHKHLITSAISGGSKAFHHKM